MSDFYILLRLPAVPGQEEQWELAHPFPASRDRAVRIKAELTQRAAGQWHYRLAPAAADAPPGQPCCCPAGIHKPHYHTDQPEERNAQ